MRDIFLLFNDETILTVPTPNEVKSIFLKGLKICSNHRDFIFWAPGRAFRFNLLPKRQTGFPLQSLALAYCLLPTEFWQLLTAN